MNAKDILKYGQGTVMQTVEGFPIKEAEKPGACGAWSVRDIIAHLASYELVLLDIANTFVVGSGVATPMLDSYVAPGGNFNDDEVHKRQGKSLQEVLAELNETHALVQAVVEKISPAQFQQVGTVPWYGTAYSLDDLIVYMYYGHKREHSAQIAAFHDLVR